MLRRVGSKAYLSFSSVIGARSTSAATTSALGFGFGVAGARGGDMARYSGDVKDLVPSFWKRSSAMWAWARLHTSMASLTQSFQLKVNEMGNKTKSLRPYSSEVDSNDEFAELGPSLQDYTMSDIELEEQNMANCHSSVSLDAEVHNNISRTKSGAKNQKARGMDNGNPEWKSSVKICSVPLDISIKELREVLTAHITVEGANGNTVFYINFKNPESKKKALAARWITVRGHRLPFYQADFPKHISVRISNINPETTELAVHTLCRLCGPVTSLARAKEGAINVVFRIEDSSAARRVIKRLNNVSVDGCRWSADQIPLQARNWNMKLSSSETNSSSSEQSTGCRLSSLIQDSGERLRMQKIYLEDLDHLHQAIDHLKDQPAEN